MFAGLSELGTEVVKVFILPRVKQVADRIENATEGPVLSNIDKIAAGHIKHLLVVSVVCNILRESWYCIGTVPNCLTVQC
jgi:transcription initiation factor TFIID subunit 6